MVKEESFTDKYEDGHPAAVVAMAAFMLSMFCLLVAMISMFIGTGLISVILQYVPEHDSGQFGDLLYITWLIWSGFATLFATVGCVGVLATKI